jgi:stress response protein YsnF
MILPPLVLPATSQSFTLRRLSDQAVQQVLRLRQEHLGGERRQQRHPQASQRSPGAREAIQVVRHEEVSAERQQGDEEDLPGPTQA